jgi:serine/threonine protein kinase/tetratricopeptide (TPR) repeat protein
MLARYAGGGLAPAEIAWVEDHGRSCDGCGPQVAAAGRAAAAPLTPTASLWPSEAETGPVPTQSGIEVASGVSMVDSGRSAIADEPTAVGPYSVEGVLGKGGMGKVYRARHPGTRRLVAVKTVIAQRRALLAGLRNEILFLKEVRHPGIVEIFDYDVTCEVPWYAMELLEGPTLATRNRELWGALTEPARLQAGGGGGGGYTIPSAHEERPLAAGGRVADVLTLYSEICVPLGYVHRAGIVHCDLKPENVFLRTEDRPVLTDFGLLSKARGGVGRESLTPAPRVRGTLPYISPEVIEGRIPDARADLYSLGCMLYESLTGTPPFWSANQSQLLRMHAEVEPEPPSARVAGVDPALDALVLGLLAKRPRDRLNDIDEVAEVLRALAGRLSSKPPSGPRPRKSAYLFRPHIAGRDEAVASVLECCRRATAGGGSLLVVEGESGIGKTFFANEVAQRAGANGFQVVACDAMTVRAGDGATAPAPPLQLFMPLLQWLRDHCREHGAEETARLLGPNARLLGELEPSLARLPGADSWPAPAPLPPAAARERHVVAVLDAITRLAETQPLLLTLDDVQWADDLSMAVLEAISEAFLDAAPVVVLAAFRTEEAPESLRLLSSRPWAVPIQLRRLTAIEVSSIAGDMLASADLVQPVTEYVHSQSEGVPFFVAEYLRVMTEEGVLQRASGQWRLVDGSADVSEVLRSLPVPGALTDIVRRRLTRLPDDCRAALEAGAVIGRRFRLPELSSTTGLDGARLAMSLAFALEHRLLETDQPREYRFPHDKIRETLYADLPEPRRRQLHGAAGSAICDLFTDGDGLEDRYGVVAHHFRRAEMTARAVPFLARAGERALRLSASADAITYLREALALEASLGQRVEPLTRATWYRMLGQALQGLGHIKESVDPLRAALELLGGRVPTGGGEVLPVLLRELGVQARQRIGARKTPSELPPDRVELGRVLDALTQAYFYVGENIGFMVATLATLNVFEDGPPSAELALAYGHAAATASFVLPALAPRYFELAHATLRRLENPSTESHVEMLHGLTFAVAGKRTDANRHLARSLELADRARHYRRWDECAAVHASYLLLTGTFGEAVELLKGLESSSRRRGDIQMTAWSLLIRGQWAIRTWQPEVVAETYADAARFEDRLATADRIWLTSQGAYAAILTGDLASARTRVERASALLDHKPPPQPHLANAVALFAETRLLLALDAPERERKAAMVEAGRASDTLLATGRMHSLCMSLACLSRGTFFWHKRRDRAARRWWLRGRAIARELELPYEEARLEAALSAAAPSPTQAAAHLERVDQIVQRFGIPRSGVIRPSYIDRR